LTPEHRELVSSCLSLAHKLACQHRRAAAVVGLEPDDLDQAAMLGLVHAAQRFDPARGFKFTTYATYAVRTHLWRALTLTRMARRLPVVHGDGREHDVPFLDSIPDERAADPEAGDATVELLQAVETLPARLRTVLTLRFGLDGQGKRTLQAVGDAIGVTRERVRQLETVALRHLHRAAGRQGLRWSEVCGA